MSRQFQSMRLKSVGGRSSLFLYERFLVVISLFSLMRSLRSERLLMTSYS